MLTRIVKMTFHPEKTSDFLKIFRESASHIRAFEGCLYLELFSEQDKTNVYFTHSRWENKEALDAYRHSPLFSSTWAQTKILFSEKPEAWSLVSEVVLD
jgi:quinol monooxygenase YgiN